MRACRHDDVPIGGIVGGLTGAIDGPAIGQMRGGQIGGISIELLHSGCISPSTHSHVQDASALGVMMSATQMLTQINACLIAISQGLVELPRRAVPCRAPRRRTTRRSLRKNTFGLTFVLYMFS
jgi:hypothetical protein